MIYKGTYLRVIDNSGATLAKCIGILGSNSPKYAKVGSTIIVTIKDYTRSNNSVRSKIEKGIISHALIVRTKKKNRSFDNIWTSFIDNGVVLLDNKKSLMFTRVRGPIHYALRFKKFIKVLSLSKYNL
jgi:large subunit ribosomal protein L14